jgi:hypothetical protein
VTADAAPSGPEQRSRGLRLRAADAEDLAVISACLQDALVSVCDLAYDPAARTFVLVANRFRWEAAGADAGEGPSFERILCGVAFDAVDGVVYRGFYRSEEDRILSLLAIQAASCPPGATVELDFAGGAAIRLAVAAISARVRDFGEAWPTAWRPGHQLDDPR